MKTLLLASTLLASIAAGSAFAADLPSRKAPMLPPPPPPPMWTGFYAGLNAGYGFGTNSNVQALALGQDATVSTLYRGVVDSQPIYLPAADAAATYYPSLPTGAGLAQSGSFANTQSGFIGGGQVGYNYQWGANFVVGLEADMQGTGIRGRSHGVGVGGASTTNPLLCFDGEGCSGNITHNATSIGSTTVNAGVDWIGTVRGRLGYLFTPTMLVYATGGLTYGGVYANVQNYAVTSLSAQVSNDVKIPALDAFPMGLGGGTNHTFYGGGSRSQTLVGWNVGGGLEWMFMPNWSLKAEGIYWNMGNMNVPTASFAAAPVSVNWSSPLSANNPLATVGNVRVNYQGVIARMGINYHFNWGGSAPVVAQY
jgi:outer membrane immunogenic protein